ncbi:MAG TPA: ABC transporter substrate-binding protein, partial [Candidatus Binatia bacterium]|nr:ABC transporter substrate-binding protein [Candidatus Binatia bacterium]
MSEMPKAFSRRRMVGLLGAAPVVTLPARVSAQTERIRIGFGLNDPYLEPAYARDLGMFREAGLDVELVVLANGATIMQAAAAGAIDVGLGDVIQLSNAVNHGIPLAFFASGAVYTAAAPTTVLVVTKNSPVRSARDLEGKSVGVVNLKSLSGISVTQWLRVNGADDGKVTLFEIPFAEMSQALVRGTVAAALGGEPYLSAARGDLRWLGKPFDTIASRFYINCFYAKRDWIARNPSAAVRLSRVFYDAGRWANAHHAESAAVEASYTKIDVGVVRAMSRNLFSTSFESRLIQPVI